MRQHIEYPLFSVCACCVYSLPPSVKALPDCQHYPAVFMEVWLNPVPTASRHDLILHPFSCSSQPPSIYRLQHFPLFLLTIIIPLIFVSPWCTVVYHLISHRLFLSPFFRFFFFFASCQPPLPTPTVYPPLLSLEFFCFSCHQLSFFLFSCLSKETSWENKKQHELKSIECIRIFRHVCLTAFCPDIQDVKVWKPQVAG